MSAETAWQQVRTTMADARNYWVCTVRPDGRPHAVPVWGVLWRDRIVFSTIGFSVKAANLRANPATTVHLESAQDVLTMDGRTAEVTDDAELAEIGPLFDAKYGQPAGTYDLVATRAAGMVVCVVRPDVVRVWQADDMFRSKRFTFEADGTPVLTESAPMADQAGETAPV